jgi:HAE1 family hydrophobic/amphiphilic exporter-1
VNLPGLSISRPVFTTMVMFAIALFGVFMYRSLSVDQFPEVDLAVITVVSVYPGADPSSVENQVSTPVEDAMNTLSGIDELRSISMPSVGQVIVGFELGTDVNVAAQDVRDALAQVDLPDQVEDPIVQKVDLGAIPVLQLAVTGPSDLPELIRYVEDELEPALEGVAGVGSLDVLGGQEREIHVWLDPSRLRASGLTYDEVVRSLGAQNIDVPGGRIDDGELELSLRASAKARTAEELEHLVLATVGTGVVRLRDVATVEDSLAELRSSAFLDDQQAVAILIRKQSDANTVAVADAVTELLPDLRAEAPPGTRIEAVVDNSTSIRASIETVQLDIVLGGLLAVAIILLFLRDWRATLISATALPVSVIGTFAFVSVMGFTLNTMTTLALSLSIGILIDDAIVVIENIVRRRTQLGEDARTAAREGTSEIMLAVLATTLSIVAVFVPVAFMDGLVGQFLYQFGLTVAFAVMLSLFVSFTLTPMLSSRFLADHADTDTHDGWLQRSYRAVVQWALHHRATTMGAALLSLVLTGVLAGMLGFDFVPDQDQAKFQVTVELPPETSLEETERRALQMATRLRDMGGVLDTLTTVGGGVEERANAATILVRLPHKSARTFSQDDAISVARQTLAGEPNAIVSVQPLRAISGGGGRQADVQIQLRGGDIEALAAIADEVVGELSQTPGYVDVDTSVRFGKPELEVRVDPQRAADAGVLGVSVALAVRGLVAGNVATQLDAGGERHDVRVQLAPEYRTTPEEVERAYVRAASGQLVRIGDVAEVTTITGPSQIDHMARQRQVTVYANLDGLTLGEASQRAQAVAVAAAGPGIDVRLAGDSEELAETGVAMAVSMGLALSLVYMILASQFESFVHPFTIMMSVPFAFVGAFGGLVVTGQPMSIFGMIGLIMLVGLVTKNAILLVDFALQRLEAGDALHDALVTAGVTRLMPILMTTAAMVFGMLPVAIGHGDGGEVRAPMGIAVIGGLLSSMVLTLVVVPVVFSLVETARTATLARLADWQATRQPQPAK